MCFTETSNMNGISAVHVKKLSHTIEEIRSRALDNIISKYDLGFTCDCDAVKKELITKLFNWFSFESFSQTEKVLDLLLRLLKTGDKSYLNAFGKLRFQNELHELRRKLGSEWYEKLNEIEETILNMGGLQATVNNEHMKNHNTLKMGFIDYDKHRTRIKDHGDNESGMRNIENHNIPSVLDNTIPFDLTMDCGDGTPISKTTEGGIKWLVLPWQPLVTSDRGVLAAVEEALNNSLDTNLILHTCQFITNVMMQDFPAEVFLQRPAIVLILHNLLESSTDDSNVNLRIVIPMVLKTLLKLTRSLRLRIYYYCEPCIANKKQKLLAGKLGTSVYPSSETRDSPDGGFPEANYQAYQSTRSNLLSVLEMLNEPNVDPKIRKSALVQISVMLSDCSLHKSFITENGVSLILNILDSALIEKDYINYPDSVISIITMLKLLVSTEPSIRQDLSTSKNVLSNIIRSLFLFPNNECVRTDGSQLLCLLLYNEYIMRLGENYTENYNQLNISLPHLIVSKMRLPFLCKFHWKISMHRRSDVSVFHGSNQLASTFIKQYWVWEWNDGLNVLWKNWNDLIESDISEKLKIQENEFLTLRYSYPYYYCQQQLYNIQNSTTHDSVLCALDYLTMYIKFYKIQQYENLKDISLLPWEQTFERFLISQPASKEDCDLFVEVLNFLQIYVNITKNGKCKWTNKIMRNITKTLAELFKHSELDNQDIHQSILKLARTCSAIEKPEQADDEDETIRLHFIELIVSTLCFGDQQHFYNLAYLDWLLTCLTYLIGKCHWANYKNLLISLGNTLIELIISFHGAGTVSFMGLSITRNSIICLNHLLYQMQINFNKNAFVVFWYEEGRTLNWLPMLWQNRDPLVRASALQLLSGLINNLHTAAQLLNTIALAPSELCQTLLQYIASREESCIVREQACFAFSNLVKNCNSVTFQYVNSLQANAILIYMEQNNTYYEITVLCSNIYMFTTLDYDLTSNREQETGKAPSIHSLQSGCTSLVPRTISYLYNCQDELQPFSARESATTENDNCLQLVATPSLITAVCRLLNNLIFIGKHEVVHQIYEHSIDKYLFGCINEVPRSVETKKNLAHYCEILEMYINILTVLTNCVIHSNEYTVVVNFSPDSLYTLFSFLNSDFYIIDTVQLISLRDRLWTEVFNFIAILSLTENQHFESIQAALELCTPEVVLSSICIAMRSSNAELRISAIGCLAFLLSQDIQKDSLGKGNISLQTVIDTTFTCSSSDYRNSLREIISDINKISLRSASLHLRKGTESENVLTSYDKVAEGEEKNEIAIGEEFCGILLHLFIAHNYNRSKKNRKLNEDKDLITSALTNLLCISNTAKRIALEENLPETSLMILKEFYVRLNMQPFELFKNQIDRDKKIHPLLHDVNAIFTLLMNFMYGSAEVKEVLSKAGLADVLHKLWAWVALNKTVSTTALKLLATYTTKCSIAAHSLTLTTTLPGTGLRRTPNTLALIHVIIQLVCKEIDKAGQMFDNHKLHFAFHILRNAVHVHECRVLISKSNLLQFFTKIHPVTTKRTKPWPLIELYCLEFLIDFTYYQEGQLCVPKTVDGLDVLLQLSKCSSPSSRILAISILRNLAFNMTNRPRLLSSVDFINVVHDIFKNGSINEIKIAGSMLWSLISNNQKGKLIVRSAGFSQSIQEALGRLTLLTIDDRKEEQELVKMLQYVLRILSPVDTKND
nr:PREDICTED: rotatin isoform X4 [Megachile rotundata]